MQDAKPGKRRLKQRPVENNRLLPNEVQCASCAYLQPEYTDSGVQTWRFFCGKIQSGITSQVTRYLPRECVWYRSFAQGAEE
jgi:hypothetical protein